MSELTLAAEVVVQARLGDLELLGDVGVADAVEATNLDEPLGDVECPICRANRFLLTARRHGASTLRWHVKCLDIYLLVDRLTHGTYHRDRRDRDAESP